MLGNCGKRFITPKRREQKGDYMEQPIIHSLLEEIKSQLREEIRAELIKELQAPVIINPWLEVKKATLLGLQQFEKYQQHQTLFAISTVVRNSLGIKNMAQLTDKQLKLALDITNGILACMKMK